MTAETKNITYDINLDDPAPTVGQYLVFLGKKGLLSVNLIRAVRKVQPKVVRDYARYVLAILPTPDLKPYTVFERRFNRAEVWVRGVEALPCFWISRSAKLKRERR